jgi:putative FmdB family regulatory protein
VPRYKYYCQDCDTNFLVFHSMSEDQEECVQCLGNNITKSVTSPSYIEKKNVQQKVGALTNKHIEESRIALKEQIKEVRGGEYEPS